MVIFDEGIDGEPLHEPVKLFRCKLSGLCRIAWPGEMTVFHTLGKEKESVPLPEEPFDLGSTPATDYIDSGEGGRIRIPKHGGEP